MRTSSWQSCLRTLLDIVVSDSEIRSEVFEIDLLQYTIILERLNGEVEWFEQITTLGDRETQLITGNGWSDQFHTFSIGTHVTQARRLVDQYRIHIASDQRLNSKWELLKSLDAFFRQVFNGSLIV